MTRLIRLAVCAAVSAAVLTAPTPATAQTPWTGTWAAAQLSSGDTFNQQTLRQIVHTSIGGSVARVRLSNAFGTQPLNVGDVHVAQRTSGSSISTGTDRGVTFGGSASVTIPAGGSAASDPIAFPVTALSDVAVSIYLPQAAGSATMHQDARQTNYVAAGDVSGNASLSGVREMGSYYFLAGLDVQAGGAQGAVVTLGASLTDGVASSPNTNRRWPNDLAKRLVDSGRTVGVLNAGISGNRLLQDGAGPSALKRFDRDVLSQPDVRWVIFSDDPINDVGSTSPRPSGDQLIAGIKQLISLAHGKNIKFLCSTLTPFEGASYWSQEGETARAAVNAFIRGSGSGCDGIVDQDSATHDPASPTKFRQAYDSGDHLHPNEAGLQAIADAVNLAFFAAAPAPGIALRAHANGKYVTAGPAPLIASATAIGQAEQFDQLDAGNGNIALRAHANNQIVTAENAGAAALIANRASAGAWETFQLTHNPDGSVSLRALVNNNYVTAENAGAAPLIANRTAIGSWEEFDLVTS
jgi:lysophospholipase L1-like esterase